MRILLVTYDLKTPGKDYESIYKILQSATSWWHYLESTWLIATNESPSQWSTKIRKYLDNNDRILIVDITNQPRQGWLPKKAWDWIRKWEQ